MESKVINIKDKFKLFNETWSPKIISKMNDYQFKIAKIKGHFTWHDHKDTDEVFIVISGNMRIDFRDKYIELTQGEMFVVPKGVEHKPFAENECEILMIEKSGTINTGEAGGDLTIETDTWI